MTPPPPGRRLLYLVTEDWYFASHRLPLARAAVAAGYHVTVACRVREHGEALRQAGCEVVPFVLSRAGMAPWREWGAWRQLVALYREHRPDLVHQVALKPVLYGSAAAHRAGRVAVVNALAGLGYLASSRTLKARILRPAVWAALRRALHGERHRLIVQNPEDRDVLLAAGLVAPEQLVLMRGVGVALDLFVPSPEPPGPPVVLLPARMLWAKGVGEFVAAARLLRQRGLEARFVLAGRADTDNPTAVPLAQLDRWAAGGEVEWWGHREDIAAALRECAVVCLPTTYGEGVPKALLEAAASARPIVATDTAGCREVVRDGSNGLLVPPHDVPALGEALAKLLADPALRARMGAAGRARAEADFDEQVIVRHTLRLYAELLESPPITP